MVRATKTITLYLPKPFIFGENTFKPETFGPAIRMAARGMDYIWNDEGKLGFYAVSVILYLHFVHTMAI